MSGCRCGRAATRRCLICRELVCPRCAHVRTRYQRGRLDPGAARRVEVTEVLHRFDCAPPGARRRKPRVPQVPGTAGMVRLERSAVGRRGGG